MNNKIHPKDKKSIVLIGMISAGKTTTGFALAQRLNLKFIDSDVEIEKIEGMPTSEVIEKKGEEYFKNIERNVILNILNSKTPQIVSVGNNSYDDEENRKNIKQKAISVFLDVDYPILLERIKRKNIKLDSKDNISSKEEFFKQIYDSKLSLYKTADIVLNTTYLNKDTSQKVIYETISQYIKEYKE